MTLPLPEEYHPSLSHDRLAIVAQILLQEVFSTETDLQSDVDDGYTKGCVIFGRQKNRIKAVALSGQYVWLTLLNGANDLVFAMDGIPCRFSTDDPRSPTKPAILQVNEYQQDFFDAVEAGQPCKFCFIVDKGQGDEEPRVVFIGQDAAGVVACIWTSDATSQGIHAALSAVPMAKEVAKPKVGLKGSDVEDGPAVVEAQ